MTPPNQIRNGDRVCVCVCGFMGEIKKKGCEGGEDEKTWGASFDAVNVQIYVEGQWSTFIRSSFLPPSHPASSQPISLYCTPLPPQAFLSSSSPLSLPLCHSLSFLPSLPRFPPVSHLSFMPPSLPPPVYRGGTEIAVDYNDQTNRRHR